ncbi:MAG: LemA family protein [Coriobacteriales bacterium]|jgi:LemA protein
MVAVIVVVVIVVVLVIVLILLYNNLIKLRNMVDNAWAQIDVMLQRRNDLIPNLINTVQSYMTYEHDTLESLTAARTSMINAKTPEEASKADGEITSALRTVFAVAENYPDLKASQNFSELQAELANTEDKISYMRQSYNDTVMKFNTAIQTFPGFLFAKPMGFTPRQSFNATPGAEQVPEVSFDNPNK